MKNKLKSMLFPIINIIIPAILICVQTFDSNEKLIDLLLLFIFTLLFGFVLGGIFPILLIVIYNIDVSEYFKIRLISLFLSAVLCVLSWFDTTSTLIIITPIILVLITALYLTRKYLYEEINSFHGKLKLVVITMSNPILLYLGFLIDFIISFSSSGQGLNIPG